MVKHIPGVVLPPSKHSSPSPCPFPSNAMQCVARSSRLQTLTWQTLQGGWRRRWRRITSWAAAGPAWTQWCGRCKPGWAPGCTGGQVAAGGVSAVRGLGQLPAEASTQTCCFPPLLCVCGAPDVPLAGGPLLPVACYRRALVDEVRGSSRFEVLSISADGTTLRARLSLLAAALGSGGGVEVELRLAATGWPSGSDVVQASAAMCGGVWQQGGVWA